MKDIYKKTVSEEITELPDLYKCKAFETLSTIILSTSTLQSDALDGGGFGPVGPDCYAIPYGTCFHSYISKQKLKNKCVYILTYFFLFRFLLLCYIISLSSITYILWFICRLFLSYF